MNAPDSRPSQRSRTRFAAVLSATLVLLASSTAAVADWLVTTDGERIETRGPWKVEGSRVIFNLPNGTLSALRAELVDLEQSRAASAPKPQAPAAKPAEREPALVLTDRDVSRASREEIRAAGENVGASGAGSGSEGTEAGTDEVAASTGGPPAGQPVLEIESWREETVDNGIRFLGTLTNRSNDFTTLVSVEAQLYDEAGELIDTQRARMGKTSLAAGASTTFDITFDGTYAYGDVVFTPDGRALRTRSVSSETDDAGATEGAGSSGASASEPPPRI